MIKFLSVKLADYIAKDDPTADGELLAYGYELIFQELVVIVLTLMTAAIFGLVPQVILSILLYFLIRRYAGGAHAKHRIVCIITSFLAVFAPAYLAKHVELSVLTASLLFAFSVVLLALYAPADTDMRPIQNTERRRSMKIRAIIFSSCYFVMWLILRNITPNLVNVFIVIPVVISCLTHPLTYKVMGCKKSLTSREVIT